MALLFCIYSGVFILSLAVDIWGGYTMCELCMTQRGIILGNTVIAGLGLFGTKEGQKYWLVILFLGISVGVWVGVLHNTLLLNQIETASCALVVQASLLPEWVFNFLSCFYNFMPCASSVKTFLGMTFSAWSIVLHTTTMGLWGAALVTL